MLPPTSARAGPVPEPSLQQRRLLDERSAPDFRAVYGRLFEAARRVDVAVRKIRLSGMSLGSRELEGPGRIRVVLAEINVLTLSSEAEALAVEATGRRRLRVLSSLLSEEALQVRSAPLAGWAPDFSVFQRPAGPVALLGPHWFHRPYPHRGPAFASMHTGAEAELVDRRFRGVWESAHDVSAAVKGILRQALERVPTAGGAGPSGR